eukprot:COSAG02_NODE_6679_length_3423_cov_1.860108_2_plen_48_part_00
MEMKQHNAESGNNYCRKCRECEILWCGTTRLQIRLTRRSLGRAELTS